MEIGERIGTKEHARQAMLAMGSSEATSLFAGVLAMQELEQRALLARAGHPHASVTLIEQWLQDMLAVRASMASGDSLTRKQGLGHFGLQRGDLQEQGLSSDVVDRLYQAMYVYSVGFSDMLLDTVKHARSRQTVWLRLWSAYSLLVETNMGVGFKSFVLELVSTKQEQGEQLRCAQQTLASLQIKSSSLQQALLDATGAIPVDHPDASDAASVSANSNRHSKSDHCSETFNASLTLVTSILARRDACKRQESLDAPHSRVRQDNSCSGARADSTRARSAAVCQCT
jgi:hypothetical protein